METGGVVEFCFDQVLVRREELIQCGGEAWSGEQCVAAMLGRCVYHKIRA